MNNTKKKREKIDYLEERDDELWEAYQRGWYLCDTFEEAVANAINQPTSRIFMSVSYACNLIKFYEKHGDFRTDRYFRGKKPHPEREDLYRYIWEQYLVARANEWLGRKRVIDIVRMIIFQPAPKFFLSQGYAVKLIRRIMHRKGKRFGYFT